MSTHSRSSQLLFASLLAALAFIWLAPSPVHAQDNLVNFVFTDKPTVPPDIGETFSLTVQLTASDTAQWDAAELRLRFDPAILQVTALTPRNLDFITLDTVLTPAAYDNSAGTISYGVGTLNVDPVNVTIDVLTITFEVIQGGDTSISFFVSDNPTQSTKANFAGANVTGTLDVVSFQTVPVTLAWFLAERNGDLTDFRWQTATESGTAGFNILAETAEGRVQLNDQLIPSQAIDSVEPLDYSFTAATDATIFYLQEVETGGAVNERGPFELGVPMGVRVEVDTNQPETEQPGSDGEHDIFLPIITNGPATAGRAGQVNAQSVAGAETDDAAMRPQVKTAQPSTQPAAVHAHEEGTIFLPAVVRGAAQMR